MTIDKTTESALPNRSDIKNIQHQLNYTNQVVHQVAITLDNSEDKPVLTQENKNERPIITPYNLSKKNYNSI